MISLLVILIIGLLLGYMGGKFMRFWAIALFVGIAVFLVLVGPGLHHAGVTSILYDFLRSHTWIYSLIAGTTIGSVVGNFI